MMIGPCFLLVFSSVFLEMYKYVIDFFPFFPSGCSVDLAVFLGFKFFFTEVEELKGRLSMFCITCIFISRVPGDS